MARTQTESIKEHDKAFEIDERYYKKSEMSMKRIKRINCTCCGGEL